MSMWFEFGNVKYDLESRTHIMGILNVTPDSFSDGGRFFDSKTAVRHGKQMESDGADFIDVGGQSTRPGSEEIPVEEELNRVIPVIKNLKSQISVPISIDTYRSEVADEALKNGATIVNDISAFNFDKRMPEVVARYNASCVLMHIKGTPKNMQQNPEYENVVSEVMEYLAKSGATAENAGIRQIIIDPGFGFGKILEHNLTLLKELNELKKLNCPILVGLSRKSMIGKILGTEVHERLEGTLALNTIAILNGANIIRIHDVKESVRAARVADYYLKPLHL
jgi:dihydropteroate synthase